MKVTIMTGLLAEGNVQVDTGHASKVGKIDVHQQTFHRTSAEEAVLFRQNEPDTNLNNVRVCSGLFKHYTESRAFVWFGALHENLSAVVLFHNAF